MMIDEAKELFNKVSDNSINYHDSTEVVSLDSINIILNEVFSRLEEPNLKTCKGCILEFLPKGRCESDCYQCSRNFNDCYELKK